MLSSSWDGVEAGLLFASIMKIVAQWTEEESLQVIEIYKTNAILWVPKHINHYKKNLKEDAWRDVSALEILDPILLSKFSKSVGDILVKCLYCPLMYWDFMSNISSDPDRLLYSSVRHQRRVFLFLLFRLAIIKAAKLTTTTTSREDITTKARTKLPFARFKLSSPTGRGRLVAETITTSDLRTAHKRIHYRLGSQVYTHLNRELHYKKQTNQILSQSELNQYFVCTLFS
jgi:hypothetical protein